MHLSSLHRYPLKSAAGLAVETLEVLARGPRHDRRWLVVDADGHFVGSVSGGCIEGAVIEAAQEVMQSRQPRLLEFGVSDEQAWQVGLACGGRVQVFVEPVE